MSTKTTFKRIALVAVAALGLGVMSVAPSSAAPKATAFKISDATVYGFVGETITADIVLTTTATESLTADDSITISATVTKPSNAAALTQESSTATTSYNPSAGNWAMIDTVSVSTWTPAVVSLTNNFKLTAASTTETNTAKAVGKIAFHPVTPGTYTFAVAVDSTTATAATAPATYTGGTITMKILSVGGVTGDGAVVSPYNAVSGVAGAFNNVTIKATGQLGTAVRNTMVVVSGSTFVSTSSNLTTLSTDKTMVTIPGVTSGSATNATIVVATPAVGTITVSTYVESAAGQFSATADSVVTITVRATAQNGVYSYADVFASAGSTTPTTTTNTAAIAAATIPTAASTTSSTPVANVIVSQYDALDNALATAATKAVVASISGAGVLGTAAGTPSSTYIAVAAASANDARFYVFPNGQVGVGTVTITVNGVEAKKYTVNFTGPVTSYKQDADTSPSKTYIGVGETGTLSVFSYDANSVKISSSPAIFATSDTATTATVSASGTGSVTVTGVAAGKTNINICNTASCTSATAKLVVPVEITKLTAETVTVSFDKATYEPGEKMVLTVEAVDSNGRPVADGARSLLAASMTSNVSFGGASVALPAASVTLAGGKATYTLYAPSSSGTVTVTGKEGTATNATTKKALTASAVIVNSAIDAATDAANDALDAANAATDAANTAAEAADAATTAAQEASDAVAALSESVTKLIAGLQAQIKSLAAVVAKIAKKVKA